MIVLPNSFERYLSALRIFVSLSILKHGLQTRHLRNLKKIYSAEIFLYKNSTQSVNIKKLCQNLLGAVKLLCPQLKFNCQTFDTYYLNKNLFSLLLLWIAKHSNYISINYSNFCIYIKFQSKTVPTIPYLKELGGYYLKLKNNFLAVIPVTKSYTDSVYIESEYEYIFDKFSIVNVFYENLL